MIVQDIMNTSVKSARSDTSIREIAATMCFNKISGVPVIDASDNLIGVLSEKDILRHMFPDISQLMEQGSNVNFEEMETSYSNILDKTVGELMTAAVASVTPDMPLLKAASLMCSKQIRRIPVTTEDNRLIGIVSIGDVHKAIFQENLIKN